MHGRLSGVRDRLLLPLPLDPFVRPFPFPRGRIGDFDRRAGAGRFSSRCGPFAALALECTASSFLVWLDERRESDALFRGAARTKGLALCDGLRVAARGVRVNAEAALRFWRASLLRIPLEPIFNFFKAFLYVCMYACMYVCLFVCMYVCVHACMYIQLIARLRNSHTRNAGAEPREFLQEISRAGLRLDASNTIRRAQNPIGASKKFVPRSWAPGVS